MPSLVYCENTEIYQESRKAGRWSDKCKRRLCGRRCEDKTASPDSDRGIRRCKLRDVRSELSAVFIRKIRNKRSARKSERFPVTVQLAGRIRFLRSSGIFVSYIRQGAACLHGQIRVTVQPGLCIHCTDRMKTQSLRASGPSRSDFQWPDAVTVQLAELLLKMVFVQKKSEKTEYE